jgi:lycopene beta-cyclase
MQSYDFIMTGGGLAGLSMAYQLVHGPCSNSTILVLDEQTKGENDRTWCFWAREPVPFDSLASRTWSTLEFRSETFSSDFDLDPYRYHMIRGIDFYRHVLDDLEGRSNIEFRSERVDEIQNSADHAVVVTERGSYGATWVFDSRFRAEEYGSEAWTRQFLPEGHRPYHYLMQHFLGWEIETDAPVFSPEKLTMFDFRTPQRGEMRFMYVLPASEHRALVEFTLFSARLLDDQEYVEALEAYITDVLGIGSFRVVDRERGVIPMTDQPFPRRTGERTLTIGTRAGCVKASTGYAFARVQRDIKAVVASLAHHDHPFSLPRKRTGFGVLDTMLLQIMWRRGELSEPVFTRLFSRNPIQRMLRFLDEETSLPETMAVMATVPWGPFIRAWIRTQLLRKV